jgi:hypothetical protein
MMKTLLVALNALVLLAAGSDQKLPLPVDNTDVNASMAAIAQACRERSSLVAALLDVERHGARWDAHLLSAALDANVRVAILPENGHA